MVVSAREENGAYRWLVLAMLVLSFSSTFISRFIWAPLIGAASSELHLSMTQAGSLMSGFYFGYLFTQIPGGFLADKFRVKYMLFVCVALVALMTLSMSFMNDYASAYAVRFAGGFFGGGIMAFCSRLLSNYFPPKERGIAFGFLLAAPSLGSLIANQVGPKFLNALGWRSAFQVAGGIIFAIALLDLIVIREPQKENTPLAPKTNFSEGMKNYFTNRQIMIISLIGFLYMAIPAGYITWANKFITGAAPGGAGLTAMQAGTIVTVYSLCSVVGSIASGFIGKKFSIDPKTFILVIYVLMIASLLAFGMQTTFCGLLVTSALHGVVSCMSSTHLTYWAVNIGGNKYAATTTALQNMIFQSANVIFPIVAGMLIDRNTVGGVTTSYMSVWYLFSGLLVGSFIVACLTSRESALKAMRGE